MTNILLHYHFVHHPAMVYHTIPHFRSILTAKYGTFDFLRFSAFVDDVPLQCTEQFVTSVTANTFVVVFTMFDVSSYWWRFSATKISYVSPHRRSNFKPSIAIWTHIFGCTVMSWKKILSQKFTICIKTADVRQ